LAATLTYRRNDGFIEGGNVVGVAAEDELAVGDNFLIDPVSAGVLEIGLERGPRGDGLALEGAGFEQGPGSMTDGSNRSARRDKLAEGVASRAAPGVVVRGLRAIDGHSRAHHCAHSALDKTTEITRCRVRRIGVRERLWV